MSVSLLKQRLLQKSEENLSDSFGNENLKGLFNGFLGSSFPGRNKEKNPNPEQC